MYKNQLQELAQRSCFNLPSYACTRQGPDHAPRFKACVNFNGEVFESPRFTTTLRQAEHSAAEVALNVLTTRGPSRSLAARILDETGVYKNLLQETAHRAGLMLPVYTTVRSGPGHAPIFTCSVEIAGMKFTGDPAKTKKQAEKNAAIAAWSSLKTRLNLVSLFQPSRNAENLREEEYQNPTRRRDLNQTVGRKMQRGFHHIQQRRPMDLVMADSCSLPEVGSSSTCTKKHSTTFVSLLPPPKPSATSILPLPPTAIRPTPQPVQVKKHEAPSLFDEHQRDDDEWHNGIPTPNPRIVYGRNSNYRNRITPLSIPNQTHNSSMIGNSFVGGHDQVSRSMIDSARYNPQRMAPAIEIRSVIPVCAAPIRPLPHLDLNPPATMKEGVSDCALPSTKHAPEELNSAKVTSTLFNDKLHLK